MLLYSGLSSKCYRQYRDKNDSLGFYLAVNEEQSKSNQAEEKNAHLKCGEDRWLFTCC